MRRRSALPRLLNVHQAPTRTNYCPRLELQQRPRFNVCRSNERISCELATRTCPISEAYPAVPCDYLHAARRGAVLGRCAFRQ